MSGRCIFEWVGRRGERQPHETSDGCASCSAVMAVMMVGALTVIAAQPACTDEASFGEATESSWTIFRGDATNSGRADVLGPSNPSLAWTFLRPESVGMMLPPILTTRGLVVVATDEGSVFALSAKTGELAWRKDVEHRIVWSPSSDAAGNVYFGARESLYALDAGGGVRWKRGVGLDEIQATTVSNDRLYVSLEAQGLQAWTLEGELVWTFGVDGVGKFVPAVGANGTVYAVGTQSGLHAITPDGTEIWNVPVNQPQGVVIAIGNDGRVVVVDGAQVLWVTSQSGDLVFRADIGHHGFTSAPAYSSTGTLYLVGGFISMFGSRAFAVTTDGTADVFWDDAAVRGAPVVDGAHRVYLPTKAGLMCLSSSGETLWTREVQANALALGRTGELFVVSDDEVTAWLDVP